MVVVVVVVGVVESTHTTAPGLLQYLNTRLDIELVDYRLECFKSVEPLLPEYVCVKGAKSMVVVPPPFPWLPKTSLVASQSVLW